MEPLTYLDPTSAGPGTIHPLAPRLASLQGTRGGLRQIWLKFDVLLGDIGDALSKEYALPTLERVSGTFVERKDEKLARWQRFQGQIDWAVLGLGACWGTVPWTVYDAIELEARGVPTVNFVTEEFAGLARETATAEGYPGLKLVTVPHFFEDLGAEAIAGLAREAYPRVVAALVRQN